MSSTIIGLIVLGVMRLFVVPVAFLLLMRYFLYLFRGSYRL